MSAFDQPGYGVRAVWDEPVDTRADFIRNTYLHLFAAVLGFVAVEVLLFQSGIAARIAATLGNNWLIVLGGFMLVSWFASRTALTAPTLAAQYLALGGFVVAEAIIFVPLLYIANAVAPGAIQSAALATTLGFGALTAIVFVTRKDFSFLGAALWWIGACAMLAIVGGLIFGFELGTWFSVGMIAFAGAAVLYDTSNVLHHYPKDRYVGASLALFASVALLFWYVLRTFMSRD
jgi:hypothetical protein